MEAIAECAEKTTRKERGRIYVEVYAQHTPTQFPIFLLQVTFFQ